MVPEKKKRKPQDPSRLTRSSQVKIRLTEEEVAELKAAAAGAGMSMADYIMAGVHQSRRIVIPGGAQVRAELLRQGKNLNQALMLCHLAKLEGKPVNIALVVKAAEMVSRAAERAADVFLTWDADISEQMEVVVDADRQVRSE